ncbi:MAG TPA: DUF6677 family protein [Verrucomicrobiae bacterium]|nr:DUF6677 family protein [Verrucomicrobiae bacterium]
MAEPAARRPVHPGLVLLAAILLPGFGHTLCGFRYRGLVMQMFMIVLGLITWQLTTPQQSLVGRLAGGLSCSVGVGLAAREAWIASTASSSRRARGGDKVLSANSTWRITRYCARSACCT